MQVRAVEAMKALGPMYLVFTFQVRSSTPHGVRVSSPGSALTSMRRQKQGYFEWLATCA